MIRVLPILALLACGSPQQHEAPPPNGGGSSAIDAGHVTEQTARPCTTAADCAEHDVCQSAEEDSYNFCGMPHEVECPDGHFSDSCGNCFRTCNDATPCPGDLTCNGSYCISARHCHPLRPPPP